MTSICMIYQISLVISLVMRKTDGLACANVNCSEDISLSEIIPIMLCCTDEEEFFMKKSLI